MLRAILVILLFLLGIALAVVGAGWLLLHRSDIPYAQLEAKYAYPNSQYQELPGDVRVHFLDEGPKDAPTLLLVHGFSASVHPWDAWARDLDDRFHIVRLDLPGHGLTRAPKTYRASIEAYRATLEDFIAARGLKNFAIVGSSMGGNIAWEYALAHPEQTAGLILVDASGFEETRETLAKDPPVLKLLRNPLLGPLIRDLDARTLTAGGLVNAFADPRFVTPEMINRYVDLSRAPGHRQQLLDITLGFRARHYATADRLAPLAAIPTLILSGDQDRLVPVEHARLFHAAIPGSKLIVYQNVGHLPQEEAADRSAAAVESFLEGVFTPALEPLAAP